MYNLEMARRALLLLEAGGNNPNVWLNQEAEAIAAIPYAMHQLTERASNDPMKRALLSQEYSVTLSSGVGDPTTATGGITSAADMYVHSMEQWSVRDESSNVLQYVRNYNDLAGYLPTFYGYFSLYAQRLYTRQINTGSLTSTTGPLTVGAMFIPTVGASTTTLPTELDDDAVRILAEILTLKLPEEARAAKK